MFKTLSRLGRDRIALVVIHLRRHHVVLSLAYREHSRFTVQRCNLRTRLHIQNLFLFHEIDFGHHVLRDADNFSQTKAIENFLSLLGIQSLVDTRE